MKLFAKITKRDEEQRMVWGYASTEAIDSQGEVVKLDAMKGAWDDYMQFANIREMHQPSAVGKCKEYEFDQKGVMIGVKVVDDQAWQKVMEEVYTGFSIGGKAINKVDGTITQLRLTEISLVDRPANPEALISVWKMDGEADESASALQKFDGLQKYAGENIWDASLALRCLGEIFYLLEKEMSEADEPPEQIAALKAVVEGLKTFITSELNEPEHKEKLDEEGDMAKAGATYSKATKTALAEVHGMIRKCNETMEKMGYDAEAEEEKAETLSAADPETIAKLAAADEQAEVLATIAKALDMQEGDKYTDAIAKMASRIAELEAMPAPAKGSTKAISKADDTSDGTEGVAKVAPVVDAKGEVNDVATLIKSIHSGKM